MRSYRTPDWATACNISDSLISEPGAACARSMSGCWRAAWKSSMAPSPVSGAGLTT
ncbi:Uncharacterised protein [Bordetella pertussis]|nr:Uncharacterised protein [Bordetella pertussis]